MRLAGLGIEPAPLVVKLQSNHWTARPIWKKKKDLQIPGAWLREEFTIIFYFNKTEGISGISTLKDTATNLYNTSSSSSVILKVLVTF